jgi:hypothetical protein
VVDLERDGLLIMGKNGIISWPKAQLAVDDPKRESYCELVLIHHKVEKEHL